MRISDWSSDVCSSDLHIAYDHDDDWAQGFYEGMLRFPVEQSFHAGRNAKVTLLAGVTSAREVGAGDFVDVALRNAINAGLTEGPRMLVAGHSLGSTGGHCDSSQIGTASCRGREGQDW